MVIDKEELRSKSYMKTMADSLQEYLDILEDYVIIDDISKEEYDDAVKTVKKLIKKLRKGKADDVYADDVDRIVDDINSDFPF